MRAGRSLVLWVVVAAWASSGGLEAANLQVKPQKIGIGRTGTVELAVDPNRLWPKPRAEILHAWWCWDIDPRPPECDRVYCDSPIPGDPICALSKKERAGKVIFDFRSDGLIQKAGNACGSTEFALQVVLEGGGVSEAKGSIEIECEE